MKGRKLFITLLVVVIAMGLLLSVAACTPRPTPPTNNNNNNNNDDDDEFDLATMLGDEVNTIVDVVDETVRQALAIDEEAHIGATLFLAVNYAGTEDSPVPPINLDLEIKVEASFDADTQTNNAVLLEITDKTENGLGLIASIFAVNESGNEYVYIGQKAWNSSFTWVKFSQAEEAGLLASFVAKKVAGVVLDIAGMDMSKKDENGNVTQELTLGDRAEDGLINGLVGGFLGLAPLLADPIEIIMPTTVDGDGKTEVTEAGFSVTEATATFAETKVRGGAELKIMVENLGGLAGALGGLVNFGMGTVDKPGLQATLTEAGLFELVDLLVGAILGQSYTELFVEQASTVGVLYPTIGIGVGYNGTTLTGIGLHYDYTNNPDLPLKLDLGVKDLIISGQSVDTIAPSVTGIADAKEAAIELTMDVILAGGAVDATISVYAYPEITIELLDYEDTEDTEENVVPFINLDLTGIKGFATITDNANEVAATVFADFNQERVNGKQKGFKLDLAPVLSALNLETAGYSAEELQYFIPLDAQKMWNEYFTANTDGFDPVANQSIVDDIMETVEAQFADGFAIGDIMAFLGFVGPVVDAMEGLVGTGNPILVSAFTDGDRSAAAMIDISALMDELLAKGGIIETTKTFKFTQYYNNETGLLETPVVRDLADYLAADAVIDSVVTLMNYNFGVSAANDDWKTKNPLASEEALEAARDAYFDDDPKTGTTWALAPIDAQEDLFTQADAIRIFKAVTGKDLSAADAYAGLTLDMFASLGASSKTDAEGITLSIALLDDTQGTLVKVALNLNIKAEDTTARDVYLASDFAKPFAGEQGTDYTDTSVNEQLIWDTILDIAMTFAQVEPEVEPELE